MVSSWNEEQKNFFFGVQPVVNYKNLVFSAWQNCSSEFIICLQTNVGQVRAFLCISGVLKLFVEKCNVLLVHYE